MLHSQCSANVGRLRADRLHAVPLMLCPHTLRRLSTRVTWHVVCAYREGLRALHVLG
jgi:hypothetical protein